MLGETEYGGRTIGTRVGSNAFKHAGAVMQTVREHVNLCLIPGNQFAVVPDVFRFLKHGAHLM